MQNAQVTAKSEYRVGRFLAPYCLLKIKQLLKTKKVRHKVPDLITSGRDDWIRTSDPLTPSQVRYQAAPRPEVFFVVVLSLATGSILTRNFGLAQELF